jgi:hypothetical protein
MKPKKQNKKQKKKEDLKKQNVNPTLNIYTVSIVGAIVTIFFGKVILASAALSGVAWLAGKTVKQIEKRRESHVTVRNWFSNISWIHCIRTKLS